MARGGKRPGAGRPKGALNRATIENKANIEQLARAHTEVALRTLVEIATKESAGESARVSAATAILDRGYGKPRQSVEGQIDSDVTHHAGSLPQALAFLARHSAEGGR
jgi:hypothetical protein